MHSKAGSSPDILGRVASMLQEWYEGDTALGGGFSVGILIILGSSISCFPVFVEYYK